MRQFLVTEADVLQWTKSTILNALRATSVVWIFLPKFCIQIRLHLCSLSIFTTERQLHGISFYVINDHPYCEDDYLVRINVFSKLHSQRPPTSFLFQKTLEKCCVCDEPIADRILRATGKPYHPDCLTCTVCSQCLDGIPFTVDAAGQIYCIDDFHR